MLPYHRDFRLRVYFCTKMPATLPTEFFSFRSNTKQPMRETQNRDREEVKQHV
jgi:hypothetical protein